MRSTVLFFVFLAFSGLKACPLLEEGSGSGSGSGRMPVGNDDASGAVGEGSGSGYGIVVEVEVGSGSGEYVPPPPGKPSFAPEFGLPEPEGVAEGSGSGSGEVATEGSGSGDEPESGSGRHFLGRHSVEDSLGSGAISGPVGSGSGEVHTEESGSGASQGSGSGKPDITLEIGATVAVEVPVLASVLPSGVLGRHSVEDSLGSGEISGPVTSDGSGSGSGEVHTEESASGAHQESGSGKPDISLEIGATIAVELPSVLPIKVEVPIGKDAIVPRRCIFRMCF